MSEEQGEYHIVDSVPPTEPEYLPSRFKRTNVDRFLPVIQRVLTGQREIRFKPAQIGISPATAIARVGDAILAITRGIQFYADVDADKLRELWLDYKIRYDHIGREVIVFRYKERPDALPDNILDTKLVVESVNFERTLTAFAWLYGTHHLIGRLTILGMLDDELKHRLEDECNVRFEQTRPNEHIMYP
jgi:hypothetical protein